MNLLNLIKKTIKTTLNRYEYDIIPINNRKTIVDFFRYYKIDFVFDIGANIGQFGTELRRSGYQGKIISFEPLSSAFQCLQTKAQNDPFWQTYNKAIGSYDGKAIINISKSSDNSSMLNPLPIFINNYSEAKTISKEEVCLTKFDSVFNGFYCEGSKIFLKVDTQGYEKEVILGGINSLKYLYGIQLELPTFPIYEGQSSLPEMVNLLDNNGFQIILISPVNYYKSKPSVIDFDCIFVNKFLDNNTV
jgi:FkbM family methyltransferase